MNYEVVICFHILLLNTSEKSERPEDWVPQTSAFDETNEDYDDSFQVLEGGQNSEENIVDIFSVHASNTSCMTF
jgi:hypothetical protein